MNRLHVSVLLLILSISMLSAEMTILERSENNLVLQYRFDEPVIEYDRSRKGNIITVDECGSAVQNRDGLILPAEIVNVAARSDRPVTVTVTRGEAKTVQLKDMFFSEKSIYPEVSSMALHTKPQLRKMRGAEFYSLLITPFAYKTGKSDLLFYNELKVSISFTPTSGVTARKAIDGAVKRAVLNPEQLYLKTPVARGAFHASRREGTYVKSGEKALRFAVHNGISTTSDQETNVENTCNGLYSLSPLDLSYLGSNIPIAQLRVRASNRMVYDSITPAPEKIPAGLQEVDIMVRDKNGDNLFNGSDELLFYGSALHFWYFDSYIEKIDTIIDGVTITYDTTYAGVWDFRFNDFDYKRHYWITVGTGSQMSAVTKNTDPGVPMSSGLKLRRTKIPTTLTTPDDAYMGHASRDWKWQTVDDGIGTFSSTLEVFSPSLTDSVGVRLWIPKKRKSYNSDATMTIGTSTSALVLDDGVSPWYYGPITAESFSFDAVSKSGKDFYYDVSSFDTRYRRLLDMSGSSVLHFYSEEVKGIVTYTVSNIAPAYTLILRINEFDNTTEVLDTLTTGGTYTFTDSSGIGYEYLFVQESGFKSAQDVVTFPSYAYNPRTTYLKRDITAITDNNDYIIVSSPEMLSYCDIIAGYKAKDGLNPLVLSTEDVYREFSGGVSNPTAVRNALAYLRASNGELKYLLLFGGGHYDYKGYATSESNHVFPYVDDDEILVEDFYIFLDAGEDVSGTPLGDMFVGRIPVKDKSDADNFISKFHEVNQNDATMGDWENRVVLMNDDDSQRGKADPVRGHEVSSDLVNDEIVAKKPDLMVQEVNFFEYPFGGSFTKPKAKEALFNLIEQGTLIVNYFGHGAYHAISDEDIFLISDLSTLINHNKGKYFIFSAFSCSVGFFDLPDKDAIASELLFVKDGGAIGSVSSTRTAYHDSNQKFGRAYFRELFDSTNAVRPLGMAYGIAKSFHNLNRYALFGDPAYLPYKDRIETALTLKNKDGVISDTFQIFEDVTIEGTIPATLAASDTNFVVITLQNQEREDEKRKDGGGPENRDVTYDIPGEVLYKSVPLPVTGNIFSHTITVPRSISQDTLGVNFKAYIWNKTASVASGIIDTFLVKGINLEGLDTTDKVGPSIRTRVEISSEASLGDSVDFADAGPRIVIDGFMKTTQIIDSKTFIREQVQLEIAISDSSGVDYFYNNAGEGITMEIEGVRSLENLNDKFVGEAGNKRGTMSIVLEKEEFPGVGEYEMFITARDILGNVSREKYILEVKSMGDAQYTMGDFFCYPSPVNMGQTTRFWFNPTNSEVTKASLKIYTLDGRLIRHVKDVNSGYTWDLTDQKGNKLSPNVYLYRLFIERKTRDDNTTNGNEGTEVIKSPIRKIVIYPPVS